MAGTLPPIFPISDDDHAGYVAVAVYNFLSLMVVTVSVRLFTRWYIARVIHADDIWLTSGMCLGILQSAFVHLAIDNGLGKKINTVSATSLNSFDKYVYAANILFLMTVTCSKISFALLVRGLITDGYKLRLSQGLMAIIALWAASSVFGLAFQCALPHPWDSTGRCVNREALSTYIGIMNILTDAALVLLPWLVLQEVQIGHGKRFRIMSMLASRLIVCITTGIQIHYVNMAIKSPDRTWASINSSIWNQTVMNLSIITTAIPSLGRLIVELQPSVNTFAITEGHGFPGDKYAISSLSGHFPRDRMINEELGNHATVRWQHRTRNDDSSSTVELVGDVTQQNNIITKMVDFEIR